jgi:hypothetical protein
MLNISVLRRRLGLLLGAGLTAAALAGPTSAFAIALDVNVVNRAANPVPTTIQGTPSVSLAGTPTVGVAPAANTVKVASSAASPVIVRSAREPFQQFVRAISIDGEQCEPIKVPVGKRIVIESFLAQASTTSSEVPVVFLRTIARPGAFVDLPVAVRRELANWVGSLQTQLYAGAAVAPDGDTFSVQACVRQLGARLEGIVSGYMEAA